MVFSDTTTSLSPASMETVDADGLRGGYPAWIINEMIKLDIDPEVRLVGHPRHILEGEMQFWMQGSLRDCVFWCFRRIPIREFQVSIL